MYIYIQWCSSNSIYSDSPGIASYYITAEKQTKNYSVYDIFICEPRSFHGKSAIHAVAYASVAAFLKGGYFLIKFDISIKKLLS